MERREVILSSGDRRCLPSSPRPPSLRLSHTLCILCFFARTTMFQRSENPEKLIARSCDSNHRCRRRRACYLFPFRSVKIGLRKLHRVVIVFSLMPALKSSVPENSLPSIRYLCSESSEPRDATCILHSDKLFGEG